MIKSLIKVWLGGMKCMLFLVVKCVVCDVQCIICDVFEVVIFFVVFDLFLLCELCVWLCVVVWVVGEWMCGEYLMVFVFGCFVQNFVYGFYVLFGC